MSCILETERLLLRPPERRDIPAIVPLANDYDVAKNLSTLPHPYTVTHGEAFVAEMARKRAAGTDHTFAITRKSDGVFIGSIGLHVREASFEFGYWLGRPYWKQGFATEAARRLVAFAFLDLKAEMVLAGWYHDNPRSGHVLAKLGCTPRSFEKRGCLARGMEIGCNVMTLSREAYLGRRAA